MDGIPALAFWGCGHGGRASHGTKPHPSERWHAGSLGNTTGKASATVARAPADHVLVMVAGLLVAAHCLGAS